MTEIEKKNKVMAEALRSQAQLYKVSENQIYFITADVLKERFEKPQPQSALNEAFSHTIGQPVSIRFMSDKAQMEGSDGQNKADVADNTAALLKVAEQLGGKVVED